MGSNSEITDHIKDVLADLIRLSEASGAPMLTYLLQIATLEAKRVSAAQASTEAPAAEPEAAYGFWEWDLASDRIFVDVTLNAFFRFSEEQTREGLPRISWVGMIHPDDLPKISLTMVQAAETCRPYLQQMRIVTPDGSVRHLQIHANCVIGSNGKVCRLIGSLRVMGGRIRLTEEERAALSENRPSPN